MFDIMSDVRHNVRHRNVYNVLLVANDQMFIVNDRENSDIPAGIEA